mmetsp:Transcript_94063/g.294111  ORF Transcript_94063/g.294111 Transcript_94063/m.294111 type:complete len:115 (-) Transcript_94063:137-481(-)
MTNRTNVRASAKPLKLKAVFSRKVQPRIIMKMWRDWRRLSSSRTSGDVLNTHNSFAEAEILDMYSANTSDEVKTTHISLAEAEASHFNSSNTSHNVLLEARTSFAEVGTYFFNS